MLQQTRAQTVIPYYQRFLERFPNARTLAEAPEAEVLTLWSGLGYYSRARNLQRAAWAIVAAGWFPRDYDGILQLPGVGPYTAAAVASIAFGSAHAVVDGNVLRVIARLEGDAAEIQSPKTRARFQEVADDWLDQREPGVFNQAMMELGATICLPRAPRCEACPVIAFCEAHRTGRQHQLPVKAAKRAAERIGIEVMIAESRGRVLLRRRAPTESLMAGFWELPKPSETTGWRAGRTLGSFRHTITHHLYTVTVIAAHVSATPEGFEWHPLPALDTIPLTTITRKALRLLPGSGKSKRAAASIS